MAYQNIKTSFVTKNGVSYNLQYDLPTGAVQLIQQNAPAGTKPIYQDGKWNASATALGFTDAEKTQLHQQTIVSVQAAYNTAGGVNSGGKLAQWASKNFTTGTPGQTSVTPSNAASSTSGGGSGGGLEQIGAFLQNPAEFYNNFAVNGSQFGVGNEKIFAKPMKYPIDMMTKHQDHLTISQFRYKPSKADAIFGGTDAVREILTNTVNSDGTRKRAGLQFGSNLFEKPIGIVFLPMPNSINDSNNVSWGTDEMGNIAAALTADTMAKLGPKLATAGLAGLTEMLTGIGGGNAAGFALQAQNIATLVTNGLISQELAGVLGGDFTSKILKRQGVEVSPESILARGAGIVPNSNMELLFNAPTLRAFNFSYRLSPRSSDEAKMVRKIIRFFKQGMAAKKLSGKAGESSFFLGTPNVFKLEYRSGTQPMDAVNKIKTCALTSFSCNYTPDGLWAAYEKGQPVSTVFSMTFNELEPIYDTDYQEDVFGGRTDLSSVSENSVGY